MKGLKKWMDYVIASVTCTILGIMVITAIWQVFTRYVLNSPSTISEELLRYLLIWVSMLGGAYAFGKKKHLAIEIFLEKLSKKKAIAASIIIELTVIAFAVLVMVIGGLKAVTLSMPQSSPALGISMGLIYLSLPVSGILIMGYCAMNIYETVVKGKVKLYSEEMETENEKEPFPVEIKREGVN